LFVTDNLERLDTILRFGLEPLSPKARIDRAKLIASYPKGLNCCVMVIERLAGQHGLYGHKPAFESERLLPLKDAQSAVKKIIARLRRAARSGELLLAPDPTRLIFAWRRLTTFDEVKSWLTRQLKIDKSALRLAETLPNTSYHSSGEGQKIVRSLKVETYQDFLDIEALKKRLEKITKGSNSPPEARRIYEEFLSAEAAGRED